MTEFNSNNTEPVSYTHLDVYKRQVWKLAPWKNKNLKAYIEAVNPDLIFSVLSSNSAVNEMIAYAAKVSGAKVIRCV